MSNIKEYRHQWVWNKNNSAGFATVKIRPFAICEDVLVFGKNKVNYYPIMEVRGKERLKGGYSTSDNYNIKPTVSKSNEYYPKNLLNFSNANQNGKLHPTQKPTASKSNEYYPKNLLNFSNANQNGKLHPTQKPTALLEYLIKTYTKEGMLILDNCSGSGTLGMGCINTGRKYIMIEKEKKYFNISVERIKSHLEKIGK